ncbi:MAG: hypothetical protein S4CHLAM7_07730 [Chlamydiae bacterium]|nr:hypothetical protein [Chlamydiota bacterium]
MPVDIIQGNTRYNSFLENIRTDNNTDAKQFISKYMQDKVRLAFTQIGKEYPHSENEATDTDDEITEFLDLATPIHTAIRAQNYEITSIFINSITDANVEYDSDSRDLDRFIFKNVTDKNSAITFTKLLLDHPPYKKRIKSCLKRAAEEKNQTAFSHIATQYNLPYKTVQKALNKLTKEVEKDQNSTLNQMEIAPVKSYIFRKKAISTVKQGTCLAFLGGLSLWAYLANSNCSGKPWSADRQTTWFTSAEQSYEDCMSTNLGLPDGTLEHFLSK